MSVVRPEITHLKNGVPETPEYRTFRHVTGFSPGLGQVANLELDMVFKIFQTCFFQSSNDSGPGFLLQAFPILIVFFIGMRYRNDHGKCILIFGSG